VSYLYDVKKEEERKRRGAAERRGGRMGGDVRNSKLHWVAEIGSTVGEQLVTS